MSPARERCLGPITMTASSRGTSFASDKVYFRKGSPEILFIPNSALEELQ